MFFVDSNSVAGESSLDRLACGLGGKAVLPHIIVTVPQMLQNREFPLHDQLKQWQYHFCFQFLLAITVLPREIKDNACANFWGKGGGRGVDKVHVYYGLCENGKSGVLFQALQQLSPCLMPFLVNVFFSYQRTGDIVMLVSWQSLPLVKAATSKWKLYYLTLLTLYCLSLRTNILA